MAIYAFVQWACKVYLKWWDCTIHLKSHFVLIFVLVLHLPKATYHLHHLSYEEADQFTSKWVEMCEQCRQLRIYFNFFNISNNIFTLLFKNLKLYISIYVLKKLKVFDKFLCEAEGRRKSFHWFIAYMILQKYRMTPEWIYR